MLIPNGVIIPVANNSDLISTVESLTPTHEVDNAFENLYLNPSTASPSTSPTISRPSPLIRSRSSSNSQPSTSFNSSHSNPATLSPQPSRIFAIRPSPIVSVPASPSFSRPNSPGPHLRGGGLGSPNNRSSNDLALSGSGILPNASMDSSHIFERDVEFPSSHHISAAEAVDVAIPAVLDEAALALSNSDHLSSADFNNYVRESEEAGSGWSSPIPNYSPPTPTSSRSPNRNIHSTSTTTTTRSFSPDRMSARGASPGGASSASFSISTPSNSPPTSFHPFIQHLSEALESEANSHRGGPTSNSTSCVTEAPSTSTPLIFPSTTITSSSSPFSSESSPSVGSLLFRTSKAPSDFDLSSSTNSLNSIPLSSSNSLEAIPVRNPRLSFTSYADILNEERLNEMLGNPREG